jgi:hypothetical protein
VPRIWRLLLLVLAVAAAAAAVNLVLLGYVGDRNDPVGKLSPVAPGIVGGPAQTTTPPTTTTARHDGEHEDD